MRASCSTIPRTRVVALSPILRNYTLLPNSAYVTACAFARAYVRSRSFSMSSFANVALSPAAPASPRRRKARRETFTIALVRKARHVAGKIAVFHIRQGYAFVFYNVR